MNVIIMTSVKNPKSEKLQRRHARIRAKISGTTERPRVSIYKSNTRVIAQIIDDETNTTLAAVSSDAMKGKTSEERLKEAGTALAKDAQQKGITKVVFDRGGFIYTGNIKVFADALREAGLEL